MYKLHIYSYSIPTTCPLPVKQQGILERKGFIVALENSLGVGYGEVAPLSDFDEVYEQLKKIQKQLAKSIDILEIIQDYSLFPCVRFGLDVARNFQSFLRSDFKHDVITLNAMLSEDENDHVNSAIKLFDQGYRVFKIKIGFRSIDEDIELVRSVYDSLNQKIIIRLDAKRNYTFDEAVKLIGGLKSTPIEYIEDPLKDPTQISSFYHQTKIPVALDETLRLPDSKNLSLEGVGAYIIKPSLTGSITECYKLMNHAYEHRIKTVFSGYFESGFGLSVLALLASQTHIETSHGLSTYQWLCDDVIYPRFEPIESIMSTQLCSLNLRSINFGKLTAL